MNKHFVNIYPKEVPRILDGGQTMLWRAMKPQPKDIKEGWYIDAYNYTAYWNFWTHDNRMVLSTQGNIKNSCHWKCPFGIPGDLLIGRECFVFESSLGVDSYIDYEPLHTDGRPVKWEKGYDGEKIWTQPHYRATDEIPELYYEDLEDPACRWRSSQHMPEWASRIKLTVKNIEVKQVHKVTEEELVASGLKVLQGGIKSEFAVMWNIHNTKSGTRWEDNPWAWGVKIERVK